MVYLLKMVIFHGYVKYPDGTPKLTSTGRIGLNKCYVQGLDLHLGGLLAQWPLAIRRPTANEDGREPFRMRSSARVNNF